ncbi:hypothetical protein D9Q98_000339 [Chlorella vulgaris]|uniref:Uncharacterized protein n=1 Tax=Chlorella vulgaris TaxID=3077 RepID=A0A9D4TYW1_CHLVU|nr:hypothetical protein D9Q98_000339 [Chlorella vulgaris]
MPPNASLSWADLHGDVLALVLDALPQQSRLAVVATCKGWRALAARFETWRELEFATRRNGSRRSELRRLFSLAIIEGGLSLHGNLSPLVRLTSLVLEAKQGVTLQEHIRPPPSLLHCELSCIRDNLPQPLSQLTTLRCLAVRHALISEGVLLAEYDSLASLTGLTSLSLEYQGEEAWLPPAELLSLTKLRHLSIEGNDCSRWPLHGGDAEFESMLGCMPQLTSLNIAGCGMDTLPGALLTAEDRVAGGSSGGTGGAVAVAAEGGQALSGGPRLLRLLAHGNQLEAGEDELAQEGDQHGPALVFPRTVRQLSIDWQLLHLIQPQPSTGAEQQPPAIMLPAHCRDLALLGREGVRPDFLSQLPLLLPELRTVVVEPALDLLRTGDGSAGEWRRVGGYWRPTRLPGQPRQRTPQPDVQQVLLDAGVRVVELSRVTELSALFDEHLVM